MNSQAPQTVTTTSAWNCPYFLDRVFRTV